MRKAGLEAEAEAYGGALGDAVAEMNRIAGANQAYLENLSEQYQREALAAVLLGEKTSVFSEEDSEKLDALRAAFVEAEEASKAGDQTASFTMQNLREEAEALATAAYESSEQYSAMMDLELDQISAIRDNTAKLEATTRAYELSLERSKGVASTEGYVSELSAALAGRSTEQVQQSASLYADAVNGGDWSTYSDYVLRQAGGFRWRDLFSGFNVTVTGNQFTGTSEDLPDRVAEAILNGLVHAATSFNSN